MPSFFDQDDEKLSTFNEAALQMRRLNDLQQRINYSNLNPLAIYPEEKLYGYQIIFNSLNSLFSECSSKLKTDESTKGKNMRIKINIFLEINPIHKNLPNRVTGEEEIRINYRNWLRLKELLFDYEILIRELMEAHDLTSPRREDLRGL